MIFQLINLIRTQICNSQLEMPDEQHKPVLTVQIQQEQISWTAEVHKQLGLHFRHVHKKQVHEHLYS